MKVFLYTTAVERVARLVKQALELAVPEIFLETYRSASNFARRLRQPKDDLTIVILLLADAEDFLDVLAMRHLFRDVRMIVIVPDTQDETIAMAHRLRPRYLTYIDGNFSGLSTVVDKMVAGYTKNAWASP
jgi:hypothetical protein